MFFSTSYKTTITDGFKIAKLTESLEKLFITDPFIQSNLNNQPYYRIVYVDGSFSSSFDLPAFDYPVYLEEQDVLFVDMRTCMGGLDHNDQPKVKNQPEFDFKTMLAKLQYIWIKENPDYIRNLASFALPIYMSWMSENIANRFNLDAGEQYKLHILAGIFFRSLFLKEEDFLSDEVKNATVSTIARHANLSADDVFELYHQLEAGDMDTIKTFTAAVERVIGSVRLRDFNAGIMISLLKNTWFGINAANNIAVALEHPPTFLSIIYAAYNERTFRASYIAKLCDRRTFKNKSPEFLKLTTSLIQGFENI